MAVSSREPESSASRCDSWSNVVATDRTYGRRNSRFQGSARRSECGSQLDTVRRCRLTSDVCPRKTWVSRKTGGSDAAIAAAGKAEEVDGCASDMLCRCSWQAAVKAWLEQVLHSKYWSRRHQCGRIAAREGFRVQHGNNRRRARLEREKAEPSASPNKPKRPTLSLLCQITQQTSPARSSGNLWQRVAGLLCNSLAFA